MKNLFTFAITCLIVSVNFTFSQVSLYGFSESTGTYTEITGGTVYGSSETTLDNAIILDPAIPTGSTFTSGVGLPIGFNFQFNDAIFDRLAISNNGWICLGKSSLTPSVSCFSQIPGQPLSSNFTSSQTVLRNRISPFGCDLMGQAGSEIRMQVLGSAPNRVCIVQWKNYRKKNVAGDNLNFQVKLYETSSKVEFVYGTMVCGATGAAEVGLGGMSNYDWSNRKSANGWNNTTVGSAVNSTVVIAPGIFPAEGKKFTWTVPQPCLPTIECQLNSTVQHVCTNMVPAPISASGFGQSDIVFQWQQSADNGVSVPWTNVTTGLYANTPSYIPAFFDGTPMYYRLWMTPCGGAGPSFYSGSVLIENIDDAPDENVSNISFSNMGINTILLNWANGNGSMRYVVMNTVNSFTDPENGSVAPPAVISGTYTGGEQVIYNADNSVLSSASIGGLLCNTTYYFKIYEYKRCGSAPNYQYFYNTSGTSVSYTTMQPLSAALPVSNNFSGFTGTNLSDVFPGWYEAKSASAGSPPVEMNSFWHQSTALGSTAAIQLHINNRRDWIISPRVEITVPSMLSFRAAITEEETADLDPTGMAGTDDSVSVLVSTGCGAPWIPLHVFTAGTTANLHNILTTYNFDLDDYIGQTIQLAFYATSGLNNQPIYDFHVGNVEIMETPDCLPPLDPVVSPASLSSAAVSWIAPLQAPSGYEYVISTSSNPPTGAGVFIADTSAVAENLVNGEMYYVWVRSICAGSSSTWTGPASVSMDYCTPFADTVDDEGIIEVTYGSVNNISSVELGNYGDYTSLSSAYFIDQVVDVSITLATDHYDYETMVWVDWNNDLDFNDPGELVSHDTTGTADTNVVHASFIVPFTAFGPHRMRIGALDYGALEPCFSGYYACFEDYTLNIGCPQVIPPPEAQDDFICTGETAHLSVNGFGSGIDWFDSPQNGNLVHTGTGFITSPLSAPVSYWVEQSVQGCPGVSNRTEVKAVIVPVQVSLDPINASCHGFADGSFSLGTVSCGNPPFLYSVNGSAFGAIPTDLAAGTYQVVVQDASMDESQAVELVITQPVQVPAPQFFEETVACAGSTSNVIHAYPDLTLGLLPADTLVLNFNITQGTETNAAPGSIVGVAGPLALPTGSHIQSMTLSMPGTVSAQGSATSDIRLGLSGAIVSSAAAGTGSSGNSGSYDYYRQLLNYSIDNILTQNVALRYWNFSNNVPGNDAVLGNQATLTIIYQAPDLPTLSWWTAPTGGTLISSADTLETIGTGIISSPAMEGSYHFYLQAEFGGCISERSEVEILVAPNPQPNVIAGTEIFCPAEGMQLTSSLPGQNTWSNGMTGNTIHIESPGTYTVTMTDANGCSGTSLPVTLAVYPPTTVYAGPDQEICLHESVTLYGSGATNYTWNFNVANGVPFTPQFTRTYTVFTTDTNGCVGSDQVKVTVNQATVSAGPDFHACAGEEIVLSGSGAEEYTWNNGMLDNVPFIPLASGTYIVQGTDENGCTDSDTVQVTLHNPPDAGMFATNNGFYTVLHATPDVSVYSYQWFSCDDGLPFAADTNVTFVPYYVGSYQVEVTNIYGCSDLSSCTTVDLVTVEEHAADPFVSLHPNPTSGEVYVQMPAIVQANLTVYDAQGKLVSFMPGVQHGSVLNLEHVVTGIYLVHVRHAGGSEVFRLVKE